ncbi:MAG: hypothetical protein IJI98_11055 [Methanosphaera sp.]|nr:hypothetical protein [Methanobrevibacter sp.]MBQ6754224.1 hypothetical protein [Bacteroidales bacterium]MBR0351332.1 hypothetical protein [Clostridia bacterium]MBR0473217.1 hypothetical protein [Methanosphaera sp.]
MNQDGPVITKEFKDNRNIITYLDENEFKKRERAIKKYLMGAYKYWIFEVIPKLQKENKIDGKYELELPVDKLFKKVYGEVKVLFTVKNDVVILENIEPTEMLLDMHKRDLPSYKGVPYRNEKDKFKIELMKE